MGIEPIVARPYIGDALPVGRNLQTPKRVARTGHHRHRPAVGRNRIELLRLQIRVGMVRRDHQQPVSRQPRRTPNIPPPSRQLLHRPRLDLDHPKLRPLLLPLDHISIVLLLLAVLAIMAAAITPLTRMTLQRNKEIELRRALRTMRAAIDQYKSLADQGLIIDEDVSALGFPLELETLVEGVELANGDLVKKKFLRTC